MVVLALLLPGAPAGAGQSELAAAQQRANAAAAELAAAQSRLAELEEEIDRVGGEAEEARDRVGALERQVQDQAVREFILGRRPVVPLVVEADLGRAARAGALARFVTLTNEDALDEYRAARADLEAATGALAARQEDMGAAVDTLRRRSRQVNDELARLERLEADRRAAERRSSERRSSAPPPGRSGRAGVVVTGSWLCPVQGPRAFSNDWGQPRSGGRDHLGNDILAPRGTPVVANVSGSLRPHRSSMGGLAYYLRGDDGVTYYGAHLDSLSSAAGRVSMGAALGTVGNSGNAAGGPTHLHFEMAPGGGAAVNPYSTLSRYC